MISNSELTEDERLDVLSKHYVEAARVVRADSGRFVVFSMTRGEIIGVTDENGLAEAVVAACQRSAETHIASMQREAEADSEAKPLSMTAGELGL